MSKLNLLPLAVAVTSLGLSLSANAAKITFGGVTAGDNSGLTSKYIDPTQATTADPFNGVNGFFIETFDAATQMAGRGVGEEMYNAPGVSDGCAVNSSASGIAVSSSVNGFQVRKGSKANVAAAPANDLTCYAHTPGELGETSEKLPASLVIDYSAFLPESVAINYFGFYWGSVDTYNDFKFYSGDSLIKTLTGSQLLKDLQGRSGDQQSDRSNVYVNVDFSFKDSFDKVEIVTSGIAGELDNIVVGLNSRPIPEPASLAVFGLGLLSLVGLSRRRKS